MQARTTIFRVMFFKITFVFYFVAASAASAAVTSVGSVSFAQPQFVQDKYQVIHQEGQVYITCSDGLSYDHRWYDCKGSFLSPTESEYFVSSKNSKNHHVRLAVQNQKGSATDTWLLNSWNGKSLFSISLWGPSGILSQGHNQIHFSVETTENEILEQGDMSTMVEDTSSVRQCEPLAVRSSNIFDCYSPRYACEFLNMDQSECRSRQRSMDFDFLLGINRISKDRIKIGRLAFPLLAKAEGAQVVSHFIGSIATIVEIT